jgi:nicotinamide phosphoribosyltransferase
MKQFQQDFFNKPKDIAVAEFKRRVDTFLGPNNVGTKHIEE